MKIRKKFNSSEHYQIYCMALMIYTKKYRNSLKIVGILISCSFELSTRNIFSSPEPKAHR